MTKDTLWKEAPEWTSYKATDANGWVYWFEHKPTPDFNGWQTRMAINPT